MSEIPRDSLLTFHDVSAKVRLSRKAIYGAIKAGDFPAPCKFGRRSLWRESEIDCWIAGLRKAA